MSEDKESGLNEEYMDGYLEEYRTLREEIIKRQDARLLVLGFTITSVGTAIGLTLGEPSIVGTYYQFGLMGFALVVIIVALILTRQHTYQIRIIAKYIEVFIEDKVTGLCWEERWSKYKETWGKKGTSMALALYYFVMTFAIVAISRVIGLFNDQVSKIIIAILAAISVLLAIELLVRIIPSWRTVERNWRAIKEEEEKRNNWRTRANILLLAPGCLPDIGY